MHETNLKHEIESVQTFVPSPFQICFEFRTSDFVLSYQVYFTEYVTVFSPPADTSTGMWIVR
jgi:hypothetical protein